MNSKKTGSWLRALSLSSVLLIATSCSNDEAIDVTLNSDSISAKSSNSVELSYNRITASAQQSDNPIGNIDDNDSSLETRWSGFGDETEVDIDFGSVVTVDYVNIAFHKGDERKAYFSYWSSNDGNNWTEIGNKTSSGNTDSHEEFDLTNMTARYVRLQFEGNEDSEWNSVLDLEIFGSSNGDNGSGSTNTTNLALEGTAEQSSTSFNGAAARAIDGNTSGQWNQSSVTHTSNESQPWWQVRLDNNTTIEEIVIWNRTNCCSDRLSNFDVFVYNTSGTQVYKTTITDTPDPSVTINTGGVNGNRVRVKLRGTNPLSLAEVQVFGDSGNGGTSTPTNPEPINPEPTNPEPTNPGNPSSNFPGEAIGLTLDNWKLNGFDGDPDDSPDYEDDLLDALNLDYDSYSDNDYFYEEDGYAWFKCYRGLGGSSNSSNPRVELRELLNGDDSYVWDGDNGTHIMEWTVRVDQLPESYDAKTPNGVLCFGQIHGPSDSQGFNDDGVDVDDTIRVQFIGDPNQSSGNVKLKISGYITEEQGGSVTLDTNYRLDTEYDFRITMSRGYITVDIDNEEVFGRQLDTSGDTSYFKVGNYLQSVKGASFDGSYGLVGVKNLSVTHPNSSENK